MQRPHDDLHLSPDEGAVLIERLEGNTLSAEDRRVLVQVVRWLFWLFFVVQEAKLSLKRLRTMLFGKGAPAAQARAPAAAAPVSTPGGEGAGAGAWRARETETAGAAAPGASDPVVLSKPTGGHRPGTGRLGAEAYTGAERVECRHEELAVGQRCPVCGHGTLYALPPGVEVRIDGQALLSAIRYELAKLRCSACGQIFTAGLPAGVGAAKYSPQARAVLAVGRYLLGLPLYRIASLSSHAGGAGPRCDAVGPDRAGGGLRLRGVCADGAGGGPGRADLSRRHGGAHPVVDAGKPRAGRRGPGAGLVHDPTSAPGCTPRLWWCRWGSTPRFCITPAAAMRAKTSRGCWTNARRVWKNRWRCLMRSRATRWPMNRG